jgi:superfamily II DNA or RNA helicase
MNQLFQTETAIGNIIPRDYQVRDVEESFRLWDSGTVGVLTRAFTGSGKTIMSCMKMDRWLARGNNHRCMVISYERELVRQFAQEIRDVMGIEPAIEMGDLKIPSHDYPRIVVASRQTLQCRELATEQQRTAFLEYSISEIGVLTRSEAKSALSALQKNCDPALIKEQIEQLNRDVTHNNNLGRVSRLHKFDWLDNWLLILDEAHKWSMRLAQTGHVIEWFEQNLNHRRSGITATPKRADGVSIGHRLFPGISIDFSYVRAVREGYAVPFRNQFVLVDGVDFRELFDGCKNQDERDERFGKQMETEEALASLCDPMLDLAGERRTMIFSATVAMAQHVADYINARNRCLCPGCNSIHWYPSLLIGDGAVCRDCEIPLAADSVVRGGASSHFMYGDTPHVERQRILREYRGGDVQFLSVCGLCKEGFNDPPTSCVAVFRPVSKAASSLAEQMKGRASRPLSGLIEGLATPAERKQAIAESSKPTALIVDLVGITGLADCASTVQIYAEGYDDAVVARAEEIAVAGGVPDPLEALEQAKQEAVDEAERKRQKVLAEILRRKEAEERARLDPTARYQTYEAGHNGSQVESLPGMASTGQTNYLHVLGIDFLGFIPTKNQAGRMIDQFLNQGKTPEEVAYLNGIEDEQWKPSKATAKQVIELARRGINATGFSPKQAREAFDRSNGKAAPAAAVGTVDALMLSIDSAGTHGELDEAGRSVRAAERAGKITNKEFQSLVELGRTKRADVY